MAEPRAATTSGTLLFLHSSDEHYGADRILLDILDALTADERLRAEFWLPTDIQHGPRPLCRTLEARGATVRHVDLPVLRRAYRTPRELARLLRRARRLHTMLRRARPTMVYNTTSATFLAAPVARLANVPDVVGHVQEIWSPMDARVLGPFARACDRLVAISSPVRDALPGRLQERTAVVLNATAEPSRVVPLDGRTGQLHFLVASRWNGWKGHRTLLEAWDRAGAPGRLTILGGPPPSGDAVDVPALVRDLQSPGSVEVVGEVEDVEPYIERADVMVVPSDQPEPFGLVAVEAFARGRPVLASRGGGLADIVVEGTSGWTFTPGDSDDLADVLGRLDRLTVTAAGRAARKRHTAEFASDRFAHDWRRAVGLAPAPYAPL